MQKKKNTSQINFWSGESGRAYSDRNPQSIQDLDALYMAQYGMTRSAMNEEFLGGLDRSSKILEGGANLGLQLELLRTMGFERVVGIELNRYAVEQAKFIYPKIDVISGSIFDLPFRDSYFDIVFTSGVLIHIAPKDLGDALDEIHRVSARYIWGFEYFSSACKEIPYRGKEDLLWKNDFPSLYLKRFSDLHLRKEKKFVLIGTDNISQMFLLEKS